MAGDCGALSACSGERQRRGVYLVRTVASPPEGWKSALSYNPYCPRTTGSRDIVVAKVCPMEPESCMRRYISVLRPTRPQ
eukprot:4625480-Prymnesium_polylepis.2